MMYRLYGRTCHKPLINSYTMKNIFIKLLAFLSPPFLYGVNVGMDSLRQEKVYVHMDKPFYLVGDTIWMKGYLVDMRTHRELDARSRFLYVELISDKDKVLLRKKIMEENGIFRNFFSLEDDIPEGRYMLRAYTNFMRNADESFFYTRQFAVYKDTESLLMLKVRYEKEKENRCLIATLLRHDGEPYSKKNVEYMVRTKESNNKVFVGRTNLAGEIRISLPPRQELSQYVELTLKDNGLHITRKVEIPDVYDYHVGFYPEGGYLLSGVEQVVAFKSESTTGVASHIRGCVMNSSGDTLATFQSEHEGIGSFLLSATDGDSLYASVSDGTGQEKRFKLPPVVSDRVALSVIQDDSLIHYRLCVPFAYILEEELVLLAHVRGQVVHRSHISAEELTGVIPKREIPEGIVHFTVFNAAEEALTERLVFVRHHSPLFQMSVSGSPTESGSLMKLGVRLLDAGFSPLQGNFSVSITDNYRVQPDPYNENIRSSLLLTSDLQGDISTPGYYFDNDTSTSDRHLDQLMLTHGWTRFQSRALLHPRLSGNPLWQPERTQVISGDLVGLFKSFGRKKVEMTVAIPKYGRLETLKTDREGHFCITHDFPDMTGFIITPSRKKAQHYKIRLKEDTYPSVSRLLWKPMVRAEVASEYLYEVDNKTAGGMKVYQLPEVTVQGEHADLDYFYRSISATYLEQRSAENALELLNEIPEICTYRVRKYSFSEKAWVYTGERHIGLFEHETFIQGYMTESEKYSSVVPGNPLHPDRSQRDYKFSQGDASMKKLKGIAPFDERCARAHVYVDGLKVEDEDNLKRIKASDVSSVDLSVTSGTVDDEAFLHSAWKDEEPGDELAEKDERHGIHITTSRLNRGRFVESLPHLVRVVPLGYAEQAEFYAPKYLTPDSRKNIGSDMRSTVHWIPVLPLNDEGEAVFSFYTADRHSSYTVVIEGITTQGKVCRFVRTIK